MLYNIKRCVCVKKGEYLWLCVVPQTTKGKNGAKLSKICTNKTKVCGYFPLFFVNLSFLHVRVGNAWTNAHRRKMNLWLPSVHHLPSILTEKDTLTISPKKSGKTGKKSI